MDEVLGARLQDGGIRQAPLGSAHVFLGDDVAGIGHDANVVVAGAGNGCPAHGQLPSVDVGARSLG